MYNNAESIVFFNIKTSLFRAMCVVKITFRISLYILLYIPT